MFLSANAGKRSLALSLRDERGADALRRLADGADVFLQSLRPGLAEELGLGPDVLRASNPRLVYCSLGAYGRVGPLAREPGYDALMQAAGGLISITGESGRPGVRVGSSLIDQGTGTWAALGVLAALLERERTGEGALVDVSLYETAVGYIGYHLAGYLADGTVPSGEGTRFPMVAPYEVFADGGRRADDRGRQRPPLPLDLRRSWGCRSSSTTHASGRTPTACGTATRWSALLVDRLATETHRDVAPTAHRRRRPGRAGCGRGGRGERGARRRRSASSSTSPTRGSRSDARRSSRCLSTASGRSIRPRRPTSARTPPRSCARHGFADVEIAALAAEGVVRSMTGHSPPPSARRCGCNCRTAPARSRGSPRRSATPVACSARSTSSASSPA